MKKSRFLFARLAASAGLTFLAAAAADSPVVVNPPATNSASSFRFQVKVTDAKGQPLPDALVECYRYPTSPEDYAAAGLRLEQRGTTDAGGLVTFTITNQAALSVVSSKPGLSLGWSTWHPQLNIDESPVEIALTEPLGAWGVVRDAAGRAVADAEVWVGFAIRLDKRLSVGDSRAILSFYQGRQYLGTRTSADGTFALERLPADATFELAVAKEGLALEQSARTYYDADGLTYHAGQSNIVLALKPAGVIEGQIVQEVTGTPVAGARVFLMESGQSAPRPAQPTGPDGAFHLTEVTPGPQTVRVLVGTNRFPDWVCEAVSVNVESGATNRDVKVTATRGGVLEVAVLNESTGKPIKDASVSASSQSAMGQSATTSEDGLARLRLTSGQFYVFVSAPGLKSSQEQASVELGQTNRLSVSLATATSLAGTVLDAAGNPAAGVSVGLFPYQQGEKRTDANGHFVLSIDSYAYRFGGRQDFQRVLIARDILRNLVATLDLTEDATNATLRLGPALTLAGRAIDAEGQTVTNATARVMLRTEQIGTSLGTPVTADTTGRFEIRGLPPGRRYDVTVQARGYGTETAQVEAAATNKLRIDLEPVQLPLANLPLAGVVLDADDKPAAGAMVNSYGTKQPNANGRTDAQGRFSFDQVCAGPIRLSARPQLGNLYGDAMAEGGDTNVTIRLSRQNIVVPRPAVKLTGTVVDPDRKPASKVVVSLVPLSSQGEKTTDAQGRFTLMSDPMRYAGMQLGQQTVIARDLARNLAAAMDLLADQTTNIDLRLEPALTIAGRAIDPGGKAITNAEAQMMFRADRMSSPLGTPIHADAEGRFEIKALPVGQRYYVTVSAIGFGQEQRSVDPLEGETNRLELDAIELPVADQHIAGTVVDANDKPAADAFINGYGSRQPNLRGQTDRKGRFAFNQVCTGLIQLSANGPYGQGYGSASAEAGDTNIIIRLGSMPGRRAEPRPASLKGRTLPELSPFGLAVADAPADRPVLAMLIDAEQRPSRRALRLLSDRAAALTEKGVSVIVLQAGAMTDTAFSAWKQETSLPFPVGSLKGNPEKARAAWGAGALPWLVLTDKSHRVAAEGFPLEELDAQLQTVR